MEVKKTSKIPFTIIHVLNNLIIHFTKHTNVIFKTDDFLKSYQIITKFSFNVMKSNFSKNYNKIKVIFNIWYFVHIYILFVFSNLLYFTFFNFKIFLFKKKVLNWWFHFQISLKRIIIINKKKKKVMGLDIFAWLQSGNLGRLEEYPLLSTRVWAQNW